MDKTEMIVSVLQVFWLLGSLVDINWFFFGIESFKVTVIRNIVIKLLTVAAIFVFVKRGHHPVLMYTAIMAGGYFVSSVAIWPILKRHVDFVKPESEEMKKHVKPNLVLFVPLLATSVFHTMDKTMLGVLAPGASIGVKDDLGYYYNADKLVNIPLGIIGGFGTVFLPRASEYFSSNHEHDGMVFLHKTHELNVLVTSLLAFGIAGCAKEFVPIFFGAGFEPCVALCYIFVPVMIVKASSTFLRMQYLVPTHRERIYTIATVCGAIVNLIANLVLIPSELFGIQLLGLGAKGAVIGTLIAEVVVMAMQFYLCNSHLPIITWTKDFLIYLLIGFIMFTIMRLTSLLPLNSVILVLLEITIGGLSFCLLCVPLWFFTERRQWGKYLIGLIKK